MVDCLNRRRAARRSRSDFAGGKPERRLGVETMVQRHAARRRFLDERIQEAQSVIVQLARVRVWAGLDVSRRLACVSEQVESVWRIVVNIHSHQQARRDLSQSAVAYPFPLQVRQSGCVDPSRNRRCAVCPERRQFVFHGGGVLSDLIQNGVGVAPVYQVRFVFQRFGERVAPVVTAV